MSVECAVILVDILENLICIKIAMIDQKLNIFMCH